MSFSVPFYSQPLPTGVSRAGLILFVTFFIKKKKKTASNTILKRVIESSTNSYYYFFKSSKIGVAIVSTDV